MRQLTLEAFTARLASSDPTPGGGSASAVAGALGAALVAMLARLSTDRGGDDALFARTAAAMDAAWPVLLDAAAEDAKAFDAVMTAMRLPRGTDDEKRERARAIQSAMRAAAEAPLEVAAQALAVLEAARAILPTANSNAVSDGGVGVLLAHGAAHGAIANVRINLKAIKDAAYRTAAIARADDLARRASVLRDEAMAIVAERLA